MAPSPQVDETDARLGLFAGIAAYTMWGFFPIYFKITEAVDPVELVAHRIVWSLPFGFAVLVFRKQIAETWTALCNPRVVRWLALSSLLIALNWGLYIWAIQVDRIFEASLGYYINPLVYVLVGVAFFGERLGRWQMLAVVLATLGVTILTVAGGVFPWVSLILAASFTAYGVIRKQVAVGAMPGLFIEVAVILLPAIGVLLWKMGSGSLFGADAAMTGLLLFAGPLTVTPLLCFALAARRLRLSTLGFLQFIGPTLQFGLGLYYGEAFTPAHAWCFGFIWAAAIIFVIAGVSRSPRARTVRA